MYDKATFCSSRRAFTLLELLIVIAILALLMAILTPGLYQARERAKRVVCRSNMKQVNRALISYIIEFDDFPLRVSYSSGGLPGWCTWSYGGWVGRNAQYWQEHADGRFFYPTDQRPLSAYLRLPGSVAPEEEMPVFRCPKDLPGLIELFDQGQGQELSRWSSYDDVGTSYRLNMHWWGQTADDAACAGLDSAERWECRMQRGREMWKKKRIVDPGRFVTLMEEPANYGLFNEIQTMGWHRTFSSHMTAFLDGHVAYVSADTRYERGREWTVVDEDLPFIAPP